MKTKDPPGYPGDEAVTEVVDEALRKVIIGRQAQVDLWSKHSSSFGLQPQVFLLSERTLHEGICYIQRFAHSARGSAARIHLGRSGYW
jgi:hypothetical protein